MDSSRKRFHKYNVCPTAYHFWDCPETVLALLQFTAPPLYEAQLGLEPGLVSVTVKLWPSERRPDPFWPFRYNPAASD
jgi:hypothetical protein